MDIMINQDTHYHEDLKLNLPNVYTVRITRIMIMMKIS